MKSKFISIGMLPGHRNILVAAVVSIILLSPSALFAQGSIYGTVQNSDLTTPANGEISFVGFLDDTDEEIRIETSDGAGYDSGNWFDDFQNYLTEAAGNPYDYYFYNSTNGEAYHLGKLIPSNSFQQENILLATASLPSAPTNLAANAISTSSMLVTWDGTAGLTYHVYRRNATSNGSYFRIDNVSGNLSDPGESTTYFVDTTVDGVSSYTYLVIAENASGDYSAHSSPVTGNSSVPVAPIVNSIVPSSGVTVGGTPVTISGVGFDQAGAGVTMGGSPAASIVVVSPVEITALTPAGTGAVDVVVTNTLSGLTGTLGSGFTYFVNNTPVADAGTDQLGQFKNTLITLDGSGSSDIDLDSLGYHWRQASGPETVTLSDSNAVDPSFTAYTNGDYYFDLTVDDGLAESAVDQVYIQIVERAPVLAAIGSQSVTEGVNLNFGVTAVDPDGTTPNLTAEDVPTNATFIDNGDGTGTFDFNPSYTQANTYNVRFIASDGILADTEMVAITVNEAGNQAPVLASIGSQIVTEATNLNFGISATDPDETTPTFTAEDVPANATFTDNGDGTGTFDFNPDYTQGGNIYNVRFIASDGALTDTETVAITVNEAGNQAPVLASIGSQSVTEGDNLNFGISATDPDATTPTLTAEDVPANATFTDNGDGTGTFDFNPDYTQAASYDVRFIASDGALADTEMVTITVNEAGNQAPVLDAIGPQLVDEGVNLNFGVSASDPDATTPTLTAENVPTNATFTDNGDGTGTFDFNPDYTQANTYDVRFIASDGALADTEVVTITVNEAGNQAPVLASIGSQSVTEGDNLNFGVSATDPDATTPTLTAEDVPTNATFTDNGNGTGTFNFDPDFTQANTYDVRFIASDGVLADTEVVTITVDDAGNQAPVLASIGSQSVTEGSNLNFGVSATDPDATTPTLTAEDVPSNATFTDNGDGTGTFDFNPDYTQAASYDVRFIASDGALADTEVVTITVDDAGNQAPVLASIGSQSVTEGDNLNFGISASDPDATIPILTAEDVPTNAMFTDNGDGTGTFDFNPDYTQANTYNIRFIASDGALADTEMVAITVNEAGNQAPVLASIGAQLVNEGANLNLGISATDPDATTPTLTAEDVPINATFTDNGDGTGTFDFNPDYTQGGVVYDVRFIAYDGALADTEIVAITVNDAGNQAPVLAAIGPQSVTEGGNLNFGVTATDADATIPTLTAEDVPANATFTDNGDGTGVFDFNPDYVQAATYDVRFIASDGALADTEVVTITVDEAGNQTPVLATIGSQTVAEGDNLNFGISATDPDATTPTLTAEDVPVNATFTDNGDGTGTFDFNPDYTQASVYNVRFIASDGVLSDTEVVAITVNEAGNQAPVLASIGSQLVDEGSNLNFGISASDPDATIPTLLAEDVPANATFTDNLDGTGTFGFDPDFTQGGSTYDVRFIATDGALADTEIVSITVNEAGNQAPVLALIGPQNMTEGENLNIVVSAVDPDATIPALTAEGLPTNATFVDHNDGTGTFDFNPDYIQASTYFVRFIAFDGALADTEIVQIVVTEAGNQAPLLATIGAQSVTEGDTLSFVVSATDPDTTTPSLIAEDLPSNAAFVDNGDGTGTFDFNPDYTQTATYDVRFIASDGALADTEIVTITVNDAGNQSPVLAAIGPHGVTEGTNLNFIISASDPDATIPNLLAEDVPANATFVDNLDGTGTFDFNPDFMQGGNVYSVRFIATDGVLADTEVVDITVADEGNQKPLMAPVAPQAIVEGDSLFVGVSASDPDGTTPQMMAQDLPENATFADNGDGTGSFIFKPNYVQSGDYTVRFIASDGVLTDTALMDVSVLEAGNQAPVIAEIDSQFVDEGTSLNLIISVTDPDTTIPTLIAENLPLNSTFTDNADGTGTFDFNPDFDQAGELIWQVIASDGILDDTADVIVTVNHVNVPPVLDPIGPRIVNVGDTLTFTVTASDFDGTIPTLDADSLPVNATFTDMLNGTGMFVFETDLTQEESVYNVVFTASDGEYTDSETVQISVTEFNQPPVFAEVAPQTVNENATLNLRVSATDPEGHNIELLMISGPANTTFVDSGNGIGSIKFKPNYYQAGQRVISVSATDDGDPEASSVLNVYVTVVDVNQPPTFRPVGPQSVLLGDSLMLRLVAVDSTDPNGGELFISALKKPANSTLVDSTGGIAGFIFKPVLSQVGVDTARFICYDDEDPALSGQIRVVITTVLTNLPPELLAIGPQTVTEADTLEFNVYATDSDGPSITLYTGALPNNATFVDSGNGVGTFTFIPDFMQSGLKSIKFYATDGIATDMETVLIQVYDNPQPPMLAMPNDTTITEGQVLSVEILATDPDSTIPSIRMDTLVMPLNMIFDDNGDGSASFQFAPVYVQSGTYDFTFIAEDETEMADTAIYTVTVDDAGNQAPLFTHFMVGATHHVFPDTLYLNEGQSITFAVFTTDADSVMPVLSAIGLSGSATFEDNLDWSGTFDWETDNFTAGTHTLTFIAEDGNDPLIADSAEVVIIIDNVNNPPSDLWVWKDGSLVFTSWEEQYEINEGETHTFLIEMGDPDSTYPVLSIVALEAGPTDTIPIGMFNNVTVYDSANGYGTLTFSPSFYQARFAPYPFRIRAIDVDDDSMYIEKILLIKVNNVPQYPVLDPIPQNIQITEGDSLELVISYSDADLPAGQFLTLSWTPALANAGATNINGNSSLFHFYPWYDQAGNYQLLFRVQENALSFDTQTVAIEVLEAGPQPPILHVPFAPEDTVDLGSPLIARIWALDPEGGSVTLTALDLPPNATFVDSSNGAGGFVFNPDLSQADITYDMSFVASDGTLADTVQASLYVREFICGDVNGSSDVDIDDIVYLITWIFAGGPAPTPLISGDVHRTDCPAVVVDIDDVTHLVTYIFVGGSAPDCTCP